jgi:hypothetical protein
VPRAVSKLDASLPLRTASALVQANVFVDADCGSVL